MAVYYPYLRARRYEVLAVARAAAVVGPGAKILPILEPVTNTTATLVNSSSEFEAADLAVSLVVNPQVGRLVGNQTATTQLRADMETEGATVVPAFIITDRTTPPELQRFIDEFESGILVHQADPTSAVSTLAQQVVGATHVFVDRATGSTYQQSFPNPRILLRDGFQARARNIEYPPRSFFTDLNLTYTAANLSGFGDYTTAGSAFRTSGGPAFAVAIHITEDTGETGVYCNHFLSTSNQTQANPAGKFGEAVAALVAYSTEHPGRIDFSTACQELIDLHRTRHFPGLGEVKRLGIQHHLELMDRIL